tara:strand:+ start:84 stop:920 length:837 start_codon:yes stop_codon:yes gene_type:complete
MKKHILTILIIASSLVAQFNTFSCFKDLRHIKESDRFYFDDIEEDINNFFTLNQLSGNIDYLDIDGSLHLIIESIVEANNQKIVNANAIVTNKNDIIMTLKSFSFPIFELKNISYNPNTFNPLSSLLEFSGYILIANELDTYDLNGGNVYYNMAREVASIGKDSNYQSGWNERWKKSKELQENIFLRNVKYHFFYAWDNLMSKKKEEFKNHIYLMHEEIESNNDFIGMDNNTKNFLKAYSKNIAEYYFQLEFRQGLAYLINYDTENKDIYEDYIKMLK